MKNNQMIDVDDILLSSYGIEGFGGKDDDVFNSAIPERYNDLYSAEVAETGNLFDSLVQYDAINRINALDRMNLLKRFNREMVSKRGTEELQDYMDQHIKSTEKDAKNSVTGIKDVNVFVKIWKAICGFFKAIFERLKQFGRWSVGLFKKDVTPESLQTGIDEIGKEDPKESPRYRTLFKMMERELASFGEFIGGDLKNGALFLGAFSIEKLKKGYEWMLNTIPGILKKISEFISRLQKSKNNPEQFAATTREFNTYLLEQKQTNLKIGFAGNNHGVVYGEDNTNGVYNLKSITDSSSKPMVAAFLGPFVKNVRIIKELNSKDSQVQNIIHLTDGLSDEVSDVEFTVVDGVGEKVDNELLKECLTAIKNIIGKQTSIFQKISQLFAKVTMFLSKKESGEKQDKESASNIFKNSVPV